MHNQGPIGRGDSPGRWEAVSLLDAEMAEVVPLLDRGDAAALLSAARRRGGTLGQLLRQLIRVYLAGGWPEGRDWPPAG